jgi:SAM-dependent methyltransferase
LPERSSRLFRLKFYLYLLALRLPRLASFLANRGQNFLTAPDTNLGDADYWRRLEGLAEMAHYAVIVGYVRRFAQGGSVLDVGCGQGLLARDIAPFVGRYLGIDRDPASIKLATEASIGHATFAVADAQTYVPAATFDAVIFNESLYYLREPLSVMRRFANCLTPQGVVIISIAAFRPSLQLIHMTASECELVDRTVVMNDRGVVWAIQLLRPRLPST